MKAYGWFKNALEEAEGTFEYKLEGLELEIAEKILKIMEEQEITRSELARRLNVSKAAVSRLLNHGSNMTLKRLLAVAVALQQELRVDLHPAVRRTEPRVITPLAESSVRPDETDKAQPPALADGAA